MLLTEKDVLIDLKPIKESVSPEEYEKQMDCYPGFAKDVRGLMDKSEWGWCTVKLTVMWGPLSASDYLGACCYASEEEFKASMYYKDMLETCLEEVYKQAIDMMGKLLKLQMREMGMK